MTNQDLTNLRLLYYAEIRYLDYRLGQFVDFLRAEGLWDDLLLIITADHGNDPTFPGSDHTREYAPLLVFGKTVRPGVDLGTRGSLADIGQTVAENFGLKLTAGESFLGAIAPAFGVR